MSGDTPLNKETVAAFQKSVNDDKRVFNDPMEAHFIGFNMWVKAVEKAGTTDHDAVIDAMVGVSYPNLSGDYSTMMPNHHLSKPVLIGEVQGNGQFNVVWQTPGLVVAQPWSPYLPESKNLIGDWLPPMSCGSYDVVAGKCLGTKKA
jgi:urea transport system substrate-binding protein